MGEAPFREFLAVRVFDSWIHEQDMRRALDRPGHLAGPVVDLSMGRMTKAMPFVVGKKVGAPDGTSVVFVVTSTDPASPTRTIPVVVDGRASVVDEAPADPDVSHPPRPAGVHRPRHGPVGSGRRPGPRRRRRSRATTRSAAGSSEQMNFMV